MLLTILRFSLFILSLSGYGMLFHRRLNFHAKVSWLAASCAVILLLYLAAFIGLLFPMAIVLFLSGLGVFAYFHYIDYRQDKLYRPKIKLKLVWFWAYFLMFAITLLQSHLEHYDNYSYWARIVKFFFTEGQLPSAASAIIEYPSYPISSSLFVYYATVIGGFSDNVMLLGQFVLIFASLYACFAVVRDKSGFLPYVLLFTAFAVFNYYNIAIRMNNLLVDFLIPVMTVAGIAGVYAMRQNIRTMSAYTFLVASVLTMVKSSALFFTLILLLYYSFQVSRIYARKSKGQKGRDYLLSIAVTLAASLFPYLIWRIHVAVGFTATKHDASISSLSQGLSDKKGDVIWQISLKFLQTVFNPQTLSTQGIILTNLILLGAYLVVKHLTKKRNKFKFYLFLFNLIFLLYYLGIYFMFLFSMPTNEALYLAGFERYASSIVILGIGLVALLLAKEIDDALRRQELVNKGNHTFKDPLLKSFYQYGTAVLFFLATMLVLSENNGMRYNNAHFKESIPAQYSRVTDNHMTLNDQTYLVVSNDQESVDSYLVQHTGKYFLYSVNVDARADFEGLTNDEFKTLIHSYDQILILHHNASFSQYSQHLFGKELDLGKYKVEELLE